MAPIARANFSMQPAAECNVTEEAEPHLAQHADIQANPFVALNTAFLQDVQFVRVPRGKVLEQPIELNFRGPAGPGASSARVDRGRRGRPLYGYREL